MLSVLTAFPVSCWRNGKFPCQWWWWTAKLGCLPFAFTWLRLAYGRMAARHFLQIKLEVFLSSKVSWQKCCTLLYFILSHLNEVEPQFRLDLTLAQCKFSLSCKQRFAGVFSSRLLSCESQSPATLDFDTHINQVIVVLQMLRLTFLDLEIWHREEVWLYYTCSPDMCSQSFPFILF